MCGWLTPNCLERMLMRWIAGLLVSVFLSLPAVAQDTALKTRLAIDGQGNVIRDSVIVVHDGRIVSVRPNCFIVSSLRLRPVGLALRAKKISSEAISNLGIYNTDAMKRKKLTYVFVVVAAAGVTGAAQTK